MKKFISALASCLVIVLCSALIMPIAGCKGNGGNSSVTVTSRGGLALEGVTVKVMRGNSVSASGKTDENGVARFDLDSGNYNVVLEDLPDGYNPESSYPVKMPEAKIVVDSSIVRDKAMPDRYFVTGDIMYDFEVPNAYTIADFNSAGVATDSHTIKLSELAQDKKAVLLNFWYAGCGPCQQEMPHLNEIYNEMKDDIAIVGLNEYASDNDASVRDFVYKYKAPFYMAKDSAGVGTHFRKSGYPTTIMIDRYGVICEFLTGGVSSAEWLRTWVKEYTADNYSQDVTPGNDGEKGDDAFTPDKPGDFGAEFTKNPQEISDRINNTGARISFSAENDGVTWPWELSSDKKSVVPTNAGHYGTFAILNAQLTVPKDTVLAFEYKTWSNPGNDVFYVAVDGRDGRGNQVLEDSGYQTDYKAGYAYVALEAGEHDISFVYYRMSAGTVYSNEGVNIRNIHFIDKSKLPSNVSLNIAYDVTRGYNPELSKKRFTIVENIEKGKKKGEDSNYYYIDGHESADGVRPMLYVDFSHCTPYFSSANQSIYKYYIASDNCIGDSGQDYKYQMQSYNSWAQNSDLNGLVPVNDELMYMLQDIYWESTNKNSTTYDDENGWLQYCVFYKHYGAGESYGNPIEGLAYFTAYEAKEGLNDVHVPTLLMPRGLMYKFVPTESGAYRINGVGKNGTDAWLYDGGLNLSHAIDDAEAGVNEHILNECGDDYFVRTFDEDSGSVDSDNVNFKMYQYLEAGKTYYIVVAFHVVDTIGDFQFKIERLGDDYYYMTTATAGYYQQSATNYNAYIIPVYADVEMREDKIYYDKASNEPIYCDFLYTSRMFNMPIETLLNQTPGQTKVDFDFFDVTGVKVEFTDEDGNVIESYEGKDYTAEMLEYYKQSMEYTGTLIHGKTPVVPKGMHPVDEKLREILILAYAKYVGFDDPSEWLKACWFYKHVCA